MSDRASQLAQAAAEGLSRRGFIRRFGRTAAVAAAALGGMLMIPERAEAGKPCYTYSDCPKGQSCYWPPGAPFGRCRKSGKT